MKVIYYRSTTTHYQNMGEKIRGEKGVEDVMIALHFSISERRQYPVCTLVCSWYFCVADAIEGILCLLDFTALMKG